MNAPGQPPDFDARAEGVTVVLAGDSGLDAISDLYLGQAIDSMRIEVGEILLRDDRNRWWKIEVVPKCTQITDADAALMIGCDVDQLEEYT